MLADAMGPAGLLLAAVGFAALGAGHVRSTAALDALPEPLQSDAKARVASLDRWSIVIFVALAIYLVAREFGHGVVGLYICEAILLATSVFVGVQRIRRVSDLALPDATSRRYRLGSILQMLGGCVGFVGCGLYLLRP